jgi:pimeloyl-ACP methyl ester carboxylesterase
MDVRQCAVVGSSLGGWCALCLALREDIDVTHVVTLGGYASLDGAQRERLRAAATAFRQGLPLEMLKAAVAGFFAADFAARHPQTIDAISAALQALDPEVIASECAAAADAEDLRPRLRTLRARVVARVGELDANVPLPHSEEIVASVPRGELQVVRNAAHGLLDEDSEATTRAIVEALER